MAENFYELLGVSENASTAAIEDAYREEIKRVHPDVSDDVDAGERTKRLNKAKQVLTDEDERARYDQVGHDAYLSGGTDNSDGPTNADGPTGPGESRGTGGHTRSRSRNSGRAAGGSYGGGSRSSAGATRSATGTATGANEHTGTASDNSWAGRRDGRNGQGRSRSSSGPTWQSARAGRATAGAAGGAAGSSAEGPSARRQASAGTTDGPNADWSWNAWERTRSWAVREGGPDSPGFEPGRLVPTQQSVLLFSVTFFLYPFFVASALYPLFPLVARVLIAGCTLLMFVYLLSVPRVAVTVFGLWSVLAPVALVALPGIGLFTLPGIVALSTTWIPLGLSLLTLSVLDT